MEREHVFPHSGGHRQTFLSKKKKEAERSFFCLLSAAAIQSEDKRQEALQTLFASSQFFFSSPSLPLWKWKEDTNREEWEKPPSSTGGGGRLLFQPSLFSTPRRRGSWERRGRSVELQRKGGAVGSCEGGRKRGVVDFSGKRQFVSFLFFFCAEKGGVEELSSMATKKRCTLKACIRCAAGGAAGDEMREEGRRLALGREGGVGCGECEGNPIAARRWLWGYRLKKNRRIIHRFNLSGK